MCFQAPQAGAGWRAHVSGPYFSSVTGCVCIPWGSCYKEDSESVRRKWGLRFYAFNRRRSDTSPARFSGSLGRQRDGDRGTATGRPTRASVAAGQQRPGWGPHGVPSLGRPSSSSAGIGPQPCSISPLHPQSRGFLLDRLGLGLDRKNSWSPRRSHLLRFHTVVI